MGIDAIGVGASVFAVVISIYTLWSQRKAESRSLRISFLLPEIAEIITVLRSMKVKEVVNEQPDKKSMQEFFGQAKDICFRKEHILKCIGLCDQVEIIINAHKYSYQEVSTAYIDLFDGLDTRYQELIGKV